MLVVVVVVVLVLLASLVAIFEFGRKKKRWKDIWKEMKKKRLNVICDA